MRHIVLVALVLAAACQHAAKPEATTAGAPEDVAAAAKGAIEEWREAYEVRSADALGKLYAHDPDLVVVRDGQALTGWPAVQAMVKDQLARAKEIHIKLKDTHVKSLAPTVATATATMSREIGDGVTTVTEQGVLTLVLRKDEGGWKIVVEHYSYRRPE
ncbi:MAG: YybH family protein [Acidobacteriota bacterium]